MNEDNRPAIAGGNPIRESVLGYGGQVIGEEEKEAVVEALEGEYITRGPLVEAFEEAVAEFLNVDHAVAVTSGTAALHVAAEALGLGPGDEVVTTPLTFVATAFTACYTGAEPVFADVDPTTRNLDPKAAQRAITDETAAIVPMHYAGQPCDIAGIREIAETNNLDVIWDASHAFGSTREGTFVGSEPDVATFSFHPVKNITTGEGGMVVTDDDELAAELRAVRSFRMDRSPPGHDEESWYQVVDGVGFNYNVTELQAALGLVQLDRIDEFKQRRSEIVERYTEELAEISGVDTPTQKANVDPMWHLYAIEIGKSFPCSRREFVKAMHAENIGVQVHYVPLHHHPHFQKEHDYNVGQFAVADKLYERLVSLPVHPGMSSEDVANVVHAVKRIQAYYL